MADPNQQGKAQAEAAPPENEQRKGMGFLTKILMIAGILIFQITTAYFGLHYVFFNNPASAVGSSVSEADGFKEVGPIVQLDELVVNPAESMGRRFAVVKIALELTDAKIQNDIDKQMPVINDELIKILASKSVEYLSNIAERDSLREELRLAINNRLPGRRGVNKIFFTGFVLQ
jgi:flagellar basal body-associated protein FliL